MENDYDLLQDVHEQTRWEDSVESYMEDYQEDDSEYYDDDGELIPIED